MSDSSTLDRLVQALRRLGLGSLAATFLEAASPLTFLGAQGLYVAAPLLGSFGDQSQIERLAQVLEEPGAVDDLARRLSEKA